MNSNAVLKWGAGDWKWKLFHAKPSSGGATGVLFCWADAQGPTRDYKKPRTADFVLKPEQGGGAPTKFAEFMYRHTHTAMTTHTKPIPRQSPVGNAILAELQKFQNLERVGTPERLRWEAMYRACASAGSFLVQETVTYAKEFGDEYRSPEKDRGLSALLRNQPLMVSLGKLFAVDAAIGNGDRLANTNTGNIFFEKFSGGLYAIDSATVLTSYEEILNDTTKVSWTDPSDRPGTSDDWATDVVQRGGVAVPSAQQKATHANEMKLHRHANGVTVAPAFRMEYLFDPDRWWADEFRAHLTSNLEREIREQTQKKLPVPTRPTDQEWDNAKKWFKAGVEEGIKKVDAKLSGLDWLKVKIKYKLYVARYGGDPNLDWTNFKMRRLYIKLRRSGKSEQDALAACKAYALRKVG